MLISKYDNPWVIQTSIFLLERQNVRQKEKGIERGREKKGRGGKGWGGEERKGEE